MDTTAADDKIQAVVRLVLQAVDQRLETVREQLLQVTHTIASNHADLNRRIDECHQVVAALQSGAGQGGDHSTVQTSVDVLTGQVAALQAQLDEVTSARTADVVAAIATSVPAVVPPLVVASVAVDPVVVPAAVAPTVAASVIAAPVVGPLVSPVTPLSPIAPPTLMPTAVPAAQPAARVVPDAPDLTDEPAASTTPAADVAPSLAWTPASPPTTNPAADPTLASPTPLKPLTRTTSLTTRVKSKPPTVRTAVSTATPVPPPRPSPAPADQSAELASLNEQISARLAAAVDRALGELSATGTPGGQSHTA